MEVQVQIAGHSPGSQAGGSSVYDIVRGVVRVLSRIGLQRAIPKTLFCDDGTELTSQAMDLWGRIMRYSIRLGYLTNRQGR